MPGRSAIVNSSRRWPAWASSVNGRSAEGNSVRVQQNEPVMHRMFAVAIGRALGVVSRCLINGQGSRPIRPHKQPREFDRFGVAGTGSWHKASPAASLTSDNLRLSVPAIL